MALCCVRVYDWNIHIVVFHCVIHAHVCICDVAVYPPRSHLWSVMSYKFGLQRQEQQQKLELCLEALGERAERIAALEADAAEMRAVFRRALEDAVGQLAEARAAAAATAAAAAPHQQGEAPAAASNGT